MHTEIRKQRIAESVRRAMTGKKFSDEHKKALSEVAKKRKKVECKHCGSKYTSNGIGQHEAACYNRRMIDGQKRIMPLSNSLKLTE